MYVTPCLIRLDSSAGHASCCTAAASVNSLVVKTPVGTLETAPISTGPVSTGLCRSGQPFPTCRMDPVLIPCVISFETRLASVVVSGQPG